MEKKATLKLPDGKNVDFPVLSGSIGPDVIDIRSLYGESGAFTYDPGFMSTASCNSTITYIDGDKGVLLYRGYPIEQLAELSSFVEVPQEDLDSGSVMTLARFGYSCFACGIPRASTK